MTRKRGFGRQKPKLATSAGWMQNALMKSPESPLADVDWEDVSIRLAAYVGYRSRKWAIPADVEDVVSETLCRVIDGDYKDWNPDQEPNFLRFCISVANGVLRNLVRRAYRKMELPIRHDDLDPRRTTASASVLIEARDNERAFALLRVRLDGDDLLNRVLDQYADGVEKTRHIAEALGASAPEVHNAKRRLLAHVQAVRALLEEEVTHGKS